MDRRVKNVGPQRLPLLLLRVGVQPMIPDETLLAAVAGFSAGVLIASLVGMAVVLWLNRRDKVRAERKKDTK